MTNPVLSLRDLAKSFAGHTVLSGFTLDIAHGEFVTLLGPSGCGKTTLLRLIAGFERPDTGTILLDGADLLPLPPERRQVNTVFQSYALFPHMTVFDNVAFAQVELKRLQWELNMTFIPVTHDQEEVLGGHGHSILSRERPVLQTLIFRSLGDLGGMTEVPVLLG